MKMIFYNGRIHTLDCGTVSAMAVQNGRVQGVGGDDEIRALAAEGDVLVDLESRCVVPGFNDSHCHLVHTALKKRELDLSGAKSLEDIVELGRAYIRENKPEAGEWIYGGGFNQNNFDVPQLPDRDLADRITTEHPLLLERICGHMSVLNTPALEAVGFDESTEIAGGSLEKDETGRLNGRVYEAAHTQARAKIRRPEGEALTDLVAAAIREANARGITSMQSDDLDPLTMHALMDMIESLQARGEMTLRLYEEMQAPDRDALKLLIKQGAVTGIGSEYFTIGNIKILTDGSLGARSAWMRAPYADADTCGIAVYPDEQLFELVRMANEKDLQVALHAIGDAAAEQCIRAVENAQAASDRGLRHRIVHGQFLDDDLLARIKAAGMGIDVQPPFTATDWKIVRDRVGEAREKGAYAWKTMLGMGLPIGGGSDSPVETNDPIWGIYCAVTRRDMSGNPAGGWRPEECLTPLEALTLYTKGSAYLQFMEREKGALAPGMYADFVVLSDDILAVEPEKIREIRVLETYIGGKNCWKVE